MPRVINLVRRSEGEFVYQEEVEPGQWITVAHVPQAAVTAEKPRQLFGITGEAVVGFLTDIGAFFRSDPFRAEAGQLRPPAVAPPAPVAELPEPPRRLVQGPLPPHQPVGVTPEQITRLAVETKIREQQIKNYLATPLSYVWQESKQLPGTLLRVPIKRPMPPPGEIEALFPLPTIPTPEQLAGFGPEPVRIFKGWLQVEGQPRINVWEDARGNEVQGYRETPGEFGQVEQILEY